MPSIGEPVPTVCKAKLVSIWRVEPYTDMQPLTHDYRKHLRRFGSSTDWQCRFQPDATVGRRLVLGIAKKLNLPRYAAERAQTEQHKKNGAPPGAPMKTNSTAMPSIDEHRGNVCKVNHGFP